MKSVLFLDFKFFYSYLLASSVQKLAPDPPLILDRIDPGRLFEAEPPSEFDILELAKRRLTPFVLGW